MYRNTKRMQVMLIITVFLICGGISTTLLGAQAKAPETGTSEKDEKMSVVTVLTLGADEAKHSDDKEAKAPLTCEKLVTALQGVWENEGPEAFNARIIKVFRDVSTKQAEELLVPISRAFLSKMSDETIAKIMLLGDLLPGSLDCFQARLTQAVVSRVVALIVTQCPQGAVNMIKCLATDKRTTRLITAEAINKPFKTGCLVRTRAADFATRSEILQTLCSLEETRNKVLPESVAKAEEDLKSIIERH